jgi:hypothetical protein
MRRIKVELDRDGFAAGEKIEVDPRMNISFNVENRTGDSHTTGLLLSPPVGESYVVRHNGKSVPLADTGNWDYPQRAELKLTSEGPNRIELAKQ